MTICICSAPQRQGPYCSACKQGLCLDVLYVKRFSCAVFDFRFSGMCLYACLDCVVLRALRGCMRLACVYVLMIP